VLGGVKRLSLNRERTMASLDIIGDRSRKEDAVAVGAAWLAFLFALPFHQEVQTDVAYILSGGLIGAVLVVSGFSAASRCRPMHPRRGTQRARLAVLALACGTALGIANLGTNVALAMLDPGIRQAMTEWFAGLSPWGTIVAAPVLEEIALRLFFLSVIAWVTAHFTKRPRTIFLVALGVSASVFGVLHLSRPMADQASMSLVHASGIVLKSGAAGILLGWIFWRWGLPYAILCHCAANAAHRLFAPMFFA
jgi:hypothetical protein